MNLRMPPTRNSNSISTLKTPHNAIAVVQIPEQLSIPEELLDNLCVALDFVQDPETWVQS